MKALRAHRGNRVGRLHLALFLAAGLGSGAPAAAEGNERTNCGNPDLGCSSEVSAILDEAILADRPSTGNLADVRQLGDDNEATIVQSGNRNGSLILQEGSDNNATITQNGSDNVASINQIGSLNYANIRQNGSDNEAVIIQRGDGNEAHINQTSSEGFESVTQSGNDMRFSVSNANAQ